MRSLATILVVCTLASCRPAPGTPGAGPVVVRVGHFPNITHGQALVAHQMSRRGQGWFEERLGPGVGLEWFVYNAGPSAMEAIFAGSLDLTYVGPSPAINAYARSDGEEIRIIAGSASGGAALVVQGDGPIRTAADFRGRRVATPQLGNTQDVACRAWLKQQGYTVTQTGGDVLVVPTANPEQLSLFQKGELDAVWTVEPWVSRLEMEAGGRVFLEERDAVTTVLVASSRFLAEHRDLAKRFAAAHAELTTWIAANPEQAEELASAELQDETGRPVPPELMARAWPRLKLETETPRDALGRYVDDAIAAGFLRPPLDLSRLTETP